MSDLMYVCVCVYIHYSATVNNHYPALQLYCSCPSLKFSMSTDPFAQQPRAYQPCFPCALLWALPIPYAYPSCVGCVRSDVPPLRHGLVA
jgi:hypothetical protein